MSVGRLANLLIVGVPKAGTTSLFGYLEQHPEICGSDLKEIGYFTHVHPLAKGDRSLPPVESYMAHFAHCSGERYALEATPSYSYGGESVIAAVKDVLGEPKIVMSLRNPTDRLWSAYTYQRSLGNIPTIRSFEQYLAVCEQRRRDGTDRITTSRLQGLAIGFYADYVPDWLDAFGTDMRVIFAEELAANPVSVVARLFTWLDIDAAPATTVDLSTRNVTNHPRSVPMATAVFAAKRLGDRLGILPAGVRKPLRAAYLRLNSGSLKERLDPELRRHVDELYASSNRRVADALSRRGYTDLPAWLDHSAAG
ncbi:MAG TPA: sulfotransferase [Candidatus Limnocylindria bacterium]|nr:sulfotransferase [Candidatus Limnocylindria bacterium]